MVIILHMSVKVAILIISPSEIIGSADKFIQAFSKGSDTHIGSDHGFCSQICILDSESMGAGSGDGLLT